MDEQFIISRIDATYIAKYKHSINKIYLSQLIHIAMYRIIIIFISCIIMLIKNYDWLYNKYNNNNNSYSYISIKLICINMYICTSTKTDGNIICSIDNTNIFNIVYINCS